MLYLYTHTVSVPITSKYETSALYARSETRAFDLIFRQSVTVKRGVARYMYMYISTYTYTYNI